MDTLQEIGAAQRERVKLIDQRAYFLGKVGRKDLQDKFGIAPAAATRDFNLYNRLAPQNLVYQPNIRTYVVSNSFKPVFEYPAKETLQSLANDLAIDSITHEDALRIGRTLETDLLATFTRAIHLNKTLECSYRSTDSGESIKQLVPHVLFDTGLHWYARGYDKTKQRFADFSLSRFLNAKELDTPPLEYETQAEDKEHQTIISLVITAHKNQKHPKTIEYDYGMENGQLIKEIRAPFAGYLLRRWNVDCSPDGDLEGYAYQLRLENIHELNDVDSLFLAPGFKRQK